MFKTETRPSRQQNTVTQRRADNAGRLPNMISTVHVAAMGKLEFMGDVALKQQQPLALLCYLAVDGPKTRRHLATVFWPNAKRPLNNLSSALTRIRERLPDAIQSDGNRLSSTLTTDVGVLSQAIERCDTETILRLYRGHFFEAADLRSMGLELEEWIFSTREALARSSSDALLTAAEDNRTVNDERAVELAEAAFNIGRTVWTDSDAWQRCYELLSHHSTVSAERVRIEAAEAGVELVEPPRSSGHDSDASHNSSAVANGLFGRVNELQLLEQFMAGRYSGWLCIVGMGGIGKTALTRAFAAGFTPKGPNATAAWVSLAELNDAAQIAEAVAASFELPFIDEASLVQSLERRCDENNPSLLVLDNLEHLQGFGPTLVALGAIPGLRMIVTSRVVTDLPGEVIVRLSGLTTDNQTHDAALAMFTARGVDAYPNIVNEPHLARRVCQLVDGLPLAIELCAGWLRSVPLSVLVDSLNGSVELLDASPSRDLESIDSVLERSWGLLEPSRTEVLNQLALFEGTFSFQEAMVLTQAPLTAITFLIDRSLVTRTGDRLELHPLDRMVDYFRSQLVNASAEMRGPGAGSVNNAIAETYPNIEAAWHAALDAEDWLAVTDMVDGIDQHLKNQSRQFLASRLFEYSLRIIRPHATAPSGGFAAREAFVAIGWRYAIARTVQGNLDDAQRTIDACLEICDPADRLGRIGTAYTQGHTAIFTGDYNDALAHLDSATALVDDSVPEWLNGQINNVVGLAAMSLGDLPKARSALRSVLDAGRKLGNPVILSSAYYSLGTAEITERADLALVLLEEGRSVAEQAGLSHMLRKLATMIGRCHVKLNNPKAAIDVFATAVYDAEDEWSAVKEPWILVCNQTGLAMAHAVAGDAEQAEEWFTRALRAEVELDDWPLMLETILEICTARFDACDLDVWRELLTLNVTDPASIFDWRRRAEALFERAGLTTPPSDPSTADNASTPRLDVVAEKALTLLRSPRAAATTSRPMSAQPA